MNTINITKDPNWKLTTVAGDTLALDTQIAHFGAEMAPVIQKVRIAEVLDFEPDRIFKHLKVSIGQEIKKGDIIAIKNGIFTTKKYVAESAGRLTGVDHLSGEVTLEERSEGSGSMAVKALVVGQVKNIDEHSISISTKSTLEIPTINSPMFRLGSKVIVSDNKQAILLTMPEVNGSVIVVPELSEYVLSKLEALGAMTIVTNNPTITSEYVTKTTDSSSEIIKKILDFAPDYVYAEPRANNLIFYKPV